MAEGYSTVVDLDLSKFFDRVNHGRLMARLARDIGDGRVLRLVLDELDKELERRGHRFCRYADDCNIYVRSQRAGERVSITRFITRRLRLKVKHATGDQGNGAGMVQGNWLHPSHGMKIG